MDLKEFVKKTLLQIGDAVAEAQSENKVSGAIFNPTTRGDQNAPETHGGTLLQTVEFDVALAATDSSELEGGIRVAGIGGGALSSEASASVSRIKFSVPIALPAGKKEL